mgnify:CR=1 FL=1
MLAHISSNIQGAISILFFARDISNIFFCRSFSLTILFIIPSRSESLSASIIPKIKVPSSDNMSKSLSIAIVVISLMMILVFRSVKIGLLSMIPNVFPVLFALGFMGLNGIWLSNLTSTVGCIVIGLAVDDTIHFISRYRLEFERTRNYNRALETAMKGVGHALVITTSILMFGFGVFIFSRMDMFYQAGMLSSLCFLVALIADFFIAPSVIILLQPFGKEGNEAKIKA